MSGEAIINSIYDFSEKSLSELKLWIEQAGIAIPINQLVGFSQFVARMAVVDANESRASATYGNLTTTGPQLTGLPPGKYIFFHGFTLVSSTTALTSYGSPSYDGSTPLDADAAQAQSGGPVFWISTANLTNQNGSTVTIQYRTSDGSSSTFGRRILLAFKYA